jgi:hypothetical protein
MPLTEGTHATGAEETLYEEGGLSGKTPAEGAGGAKETTGAARTGGGGGAHPMGDFGDGGDMGSSRGVMVGEGVVIPGGEP